MFITRAPGRAGCGRGRVRHPARDVHVPRQDRLLRVARAGHRDRGHAAPPAAGDGRDAEPAGDEGASVLCVLAMIWRRLSCGYCI